MSQNRLQKHAVNDWTRGIARFGPAAVVTKIHMPRKKKKKMKQNGTLFFNYFYKSENALQQLLFLLFHFDDYDDTSQENVMVCRLAVIAQEGGRGVGWGVVLETAHTGNRCVKRLCVCHIELLCIPLIVWSRFSLSFFSMQNLSSGISVPAAAINSK